MIAKTAEDDRLAAGATKRRRNQTLHTGVSFHSHPINQEFTAPKHNLEQDFKNYTSYTYISTDREHPPIQSPIHLVTHRNISASKGGKYFGSDLVSRVTKVKDVYDEC
jgi:hypothetical protein